MEEPVSIWPAQIFHQIQENAEEEDSEGILWPKWSYLPSGRKRHALEQNSFFLKVMPKWQIGHVLFFPLTEERLQGVTYYYKCLCFRCLRLGETSLLEEYSINMLSEASSLTPGWRAHYTCLGIYVLDGCFCKVCRKNSNDFLKTGPDAFKIMSCTFCCSVSMP